MLSIPAATQRESCGLLLALPNASDHAGGARDSTMCEDIAAAWRASDGYKLPLPPEDDPSCHAVDSRPADGVRSYVAIMIHGGLAKGQWAIPSSRMWPREPTYSFPWLLVTRSAQQTDLCLRSWYFPPPPTPRRRSDDWRARRRARHPSLAVRRRWRRTARERRSFSDRTF